jgi:hypothetical protein
VNIFKECSNCSQAVISVYAEDFGFFRENALRIARGFGGGMGRMAQPAGAAAAKENGLFVSVCPKLVGDAAEILEEMMNK